MTVMIGSEAAAAPISARAAAAVLDLLIAFFAAFALAPLTGLDTRISILIVAGGGWLYRFRFGVTPGQQIMGLRREQARLVRARRRGAFFFLAALLVLLYLGLTFSAGAFVRVLVDKRVDARAVNMPVVSWTPPPRAPIGIEQWIDGAAMEVPREHAGYAAEITSCCVYYGAFQKEPIDPGFIVFVLRDIHPFAYCEGTTSKVLRFVTGCNEGPLAFQRAVVDARQSKRDFALSPLGVVRANFDLIAKNIYLQDADPSQPLRTFRSGSAEVVWMTGTRTIRKGAVTAAAKIDRFLLADGASFAAIDLVWKKVPRDERLAAAFASTLALRASRPSDAAAESQRAGRGEATAHLYNAYRLSGKRPAELQALRRQLAAAGTPREREYQPR